MASHLSLSITLRWTRLPRHDCFFYCVGALVVLYFQSMRSVVILWRAQGDSWYSTNRSTWPRISLLWSMYFPRVLFEGSAIRSSCLVKSREILHKYDTYDTTWTRTRRSSHVFFPRVLGANTSRRLLSVWFLKYFRTKNEKTPIVIVYK